MNGWIGKAAEKKVNAAAVRVRASALATAAGSISASGKQFANGEPRMCRPRNVREVEAQVDQLDPI